MATLNVHKWLEPYVMPSSSFVPNEKGIAELTKNLKVFLDVSSRQVSSQRAFGALVTSLAQNGDTLLSHSDPRDPHSIKYKIIGLHVLDCLLDVNDEEAQFRRTDIAGNIRRIFELDKPNLDTLAPVIRIAAGCIGHFARIASTNEIDYLQNSFLSLITKLLIDMKSDCHRYSGLYIMHHIALNLPQLLYAKRKTLLAPLWELSSDKTAMVQKAAGLALESCLIIISQRESLIEYLKTAVKHIDAGLTTSASEKISGALIVFDIMISGNLITSTDLNTIGKSQGFPFTELIWKVFQEKDNRDPNVKTKIIEIIPKLANAFPSQFCQPNSFSHPNTFLTFTIKFLTDVIKGKKDRNSAYLALAKLFSALPSQFRAVLMITDVIGIIREGFETPFCPEALTCLGALVTTCPGSRKIIDENFVSQLFSAGLTKHLTDSLKSISKHIPTLRSVIQEHLRSHISAILDQFAVLLDESNGKARTLINGKRVPSFMNSPPVKTMTRQALFTVFTTSVVQEPTPAAVAAMEAANNHQTEESILLALEVLSSHELFPKELRDNKVKVDLNVTSTDSISSLNAMKQSVVKFLDDYNIDIRSAAALTCVSILDSVVGHIDIRSKSYVTMSQIVSRLLIMCVGDDDLNLRIRLINAFTPALDHLLSSSENIHCMVECLSDESIDIRQAAMSVLARTAHYDGLHIMPLVRLHLKQHIKQLHISKDATVKYESVLLLQAIVRGANTLIVPNVNQILEPLLALINDPLPNIVDVALSTIGDLGLASPESVKDHLDELFPRLIKALNDSSSHIKQEVAVAAIGKLVPALTTVTDEPYMRYPGLLESMTRAIQSNNGPSSLLIHEALRTSGLLGIVSPTVYQKHFRQVRDSDDKMLDANDDKDDGDCSDEDFETDFEEDSSNKNNYETHNDTLPFGVATSEKVASASSEKESEKSSMEKIYFSVIMRQLIAILKDDELSLHHHTACTVAYKVVRVAGKEAASKAQPLFDALLNRLYRTEPGNNLRETLIGQVTLLVQIMGKKIRKYSAQLVQLVNEFMSQHLLICVALIEALYDNLATPDFQRSLQDILPGLNRIIREELTSDIYRDDGIVLANAGGATAGTPTPSMAGGVAAQQIRSEKRSEMKNTERILYLISKISNKCGDCREQLLTILMSLFSANAPTDIRKKTIFTITQLCTDSSILLNNSNIVMQPLIRMVTPRTDPMLLVAIYSTFSWVLSKLERNYIPFIIPIRRKLANLTNKDGIKPQQLEEYEDLVNRLLKQKSIPVIDMELRSLQIMWGNVTKNSFVGPNGAQGMNSDQNFKIGMQSLETAWALAGRSNASDLVEWMRRLSVELVRQSPSALIRSCTTLVKVYRPLAEELFNYSFHCVWEELYAGSSLEIAEDIPLINSIEMALRSKSIPHNIMCALLNLAEFMDMQDRPLPIDVNLLGKRAQSANMFAKSLRYREVEYSSNNLLPSGECIEALITVNNELGLGDRAMGVLQDISLRYSQKINIDPVWLEKLNLWEDAQEMYSEGTFIFRQREDDSTLFKNQEWVANELGEMRCLEELGQYKSLFDQAVRLRDRFRSADPGTFGDNPDVATWLAEIQRLGAHAAWILNKWEDMDAFIDMQEANTGLEDGNIVLTKNMAFYHIIRAVQKQDYSKALDLITEIRTSLAPGLSSLLSENYTRACRGMVTMQVLSELEEVIEYKQVASNVSAATSTSKLEVEKMSGVVLSPSVTDMNAMRSNLTLPRTASFTDDQGMNMELSGIDLKAKKSDLVKKWRNRMVWAPRDVSAYRQILAVHTLVAEPWDDLESWLGLVSLCRKEGKFTLCENILKRLGAPIIDDDGAAPEGLALDEPIFKTPVKQPSFSEPKFTTPKVGSSSTSGSSSSQSQSMDGRNKSRVLFSTFKYWWACGERSKAIAGLTSFLQSSIPSVALGFAAQANSTSTVQQDLRNLRVQCLLKKAEWMREMGESKPEDIMNTIMEARELAPDHHGCWHAWAVINFDQLQSADAKAKSNTQQRSSFSKESSALSAFGASETFSFFRKITGNHGSGKHSNNNPGRGSEKPSKAGAAGIASFLSVKQADISSNYVIEAIKGFVRSIILGNGQPSSYVLQDILRLLTLWFNYGSKEDILNILDGELDRLAPEIWLSVIPQLIARMHIKSPGISAQLKKTLTKVAGIHPQALVYPISVATNTNDEQQKQLAKDILAEMRKRRSQLVEEATMVSRELMQVAITPYEQWYDGIEKACACYVEGNVEGMLDILIRLHTAMNDHFSKRASLIQPRNKQTDSLSGELGVVGFDTLRDVSFRHSHGRQLSEAKEWMCQFMASGRTPDLHQAWDIYYNVYKKIESQIKTFKKLEMHQLSPYLTKTTDMKLTVPGLYRPHETVISIVKFSPTVRVIQSKQRPRKICIIGSDGNKYPFLLKGNEDLRQDERVMQLFGLINICLSNDRVTGNRGLNIVRYSVLPLSNNSGVIGWVENCDTLNQLITEYRQSRGLKHAIELKLLQSKSFNYDMGYTKNPMKNSLTLMQKVEIFESIWEETSGQDIARMIWLRSKTADVWVERRANYTKSMALMSMAGYILGLGDRHPSNLMLDRISGHIVHIDFGDCFEITKYRPKFPELIPFRLTRMLITCMDRSGIEGTYRVNCERVMRVLRDNKDSVMAMLEAFVYDPLISWKLLTGKEETKETNIANTNKNSASISRDSEAPSTTQESTDSTANNNNNNKLDSKSPQSPQNNNNNNNNNNTVNPVDILRGKLGKMLSKTSNKTAKPSELTSYDYDDIMSSNDTRKEAGDPMSAPDKITGVLANNDVLRQKTAEISEKEPMPQNLNARAVEVILRIQSKLTGRDFIKPSSTSQSSSQSSSSSSSSSSTTANAVSSSSDDSIDDLSVEQQVDKLIHEAKSVENLCQLFVGWCPLW